MSKMVIRSNLNLVMFFGGGSAGSYLAGLWRCSRGSYSMPFLWNTITMCVVTVCGLAKLSLDRTSRKLQRQAAPAAIGGGGGGERAQHERPGHG